MKYHHFIWDFDGTLFDSYPVMAESFRAALNERDIREPSETIAAYMKVSMGHAVGHYQKQYGLDEAFFKRYEALRKTAEGEHLRPFEGAIEFCRAVCSHGGRNYLLTHRGASASSFLEKFGLIDSFTEQITAQQDFPRKPNPSAIRYLMSRYEISSGDAVMIGDRDLDILAGKNAGIHTCFFTDGGEPSQIAEESVSAFSQLYPLFDLK